MTKIYCDICEVEVEVNSVYYDVIAKIDGVNWIELTDVCEDCKGKFQAKIEEFKKEVGLSDE